MRGFGVHTSMWAMGWTREAAERAVAAAKRYELDFIEIALLQPAAADASHTRKLLEDNHLIAVCSLGLPETAWASVRPDTAIDYLNVAINKTADMGCQALSGVIYGGIGERTGKPPTPREIENITRVLVASAKTAKSRGIELGIEAVTGMKITSSTRLNRPSIWWSGLVPTMYSCISIRIT